MKPSAIHNLCVAGLLLLSAFAGLGSAAAQNTETQAAVRVDSIRSDRPVLLFFTASWCGPCRMIKGVTFHDPEVVALLQRIDIRMLDIGTPAGKAYQKVYGSGRGGVPELVLFDRTGKKLASMGGYCKDPQRTVEFLKQAFPAGEPEPPVAAIAEEPVPVPDVATEDTRIALPPATSPEAFQGEHPGLMLRLSCSPWALNFGAGTSFSGIASSEFDEIRTGFYVSATTSCRIIRRLEVEAGLVFNAMGGKNASQVLRSYYLTLPVEVEYEVARLFGVGILLSGGPYGACRVGYAAPDGLVPERWDAGVLGRLIVEAGSFRLSGGYSRGLTHCLGDRGYNQAFTVGLTICLGK